MLGGVQRGLGGNRCKEREGGAREMVGRVGWGVAGLRRKHEE